MLYKNLLFKPTQKIFTILFFISSSAFSQYQIGHTTITFVDPSRDNRSIETEIFYPSDIAGDDVALSSIGGQFPVLTFGHGFLMGFDAYENIWTGVVPQGFIMAFPTTEGGILPSHAQYGLDLGFVGEQLELLGNDSNSIFYNRVSPLNAVMGHSMGGGASFLAAQSSTSIEAIAVLAPAETNPSAIASASDIQIPALIIAGANDCVTPPESNQLPMYDGLASDCKTYISIIGGSHCQMADSNFFCGIGEATCSPQPEITRDEQHQVIINYLLPWLKSQLLDDCISGDAFNNQIVTDTAINFQKNCLQCAPLAIGQVSEDFIIFPNPFDEILIVSSAQTPDANIAFYDINGRLLFSESINDGLITSGRELKSGNYLYTINVQW